MLHPFSRRLMRPIGLFVLFGLTSPVGAAVYCVDSAATLKTALSQAATNSVDDEIQIVRGTYVGNFVYASTQANALSVKGGYAPGCGSRTLDPVNTILDGNQTGTVLALSASEAAEFMVQGLTLRNGNHDGHGGGLYAKVGQNGLVTVERSYIIDNKANDYGGVYVYADYGTVTLTNNHIQGNTAFNCNGGVSVYADYGTATLANNYIQGNTASYNGDIMIFGGSSGVSMYADYGTATLTNNHIQGNTTINGYSGGGAYVSASTAMLTNNNIQGNTALKSYGGGAYISASTATFNNILIS